MFCFYINDVFVNLVVLTASYFVNYFYRNAMTEKRSGKDWRWARKLMSIVVWAIQTAPEKNPAYIHDFKVVSSQNDYE